MGEEKKLEEARNWCQLKYITTQRKYKDWRKEHERSV